MGEGRGRQNPENYARFCKRARWFGIQNLYQHCYSTRWTDTGLSKLGKSPGDRHLMNDPSPQSLSPLPSIPRWTDTGLSKLGKSPGD